MQSVMADEAAMNQADIRDRERLSAPPKAASGETGQPSRLVLGAGTLMFSIAGILSLAAAIECHTVVSRTASVSFLPSAIYGLVLWLWWAPVTLLLWKAGKTFPSVRRVSPTNIVQQLLFGMAVTCLHLVTLHWTVRALVQGWPELWNAGYGSLTYFNIGRGSLDFLIYALLWAACAAIAMQIAAQAEAIASLELKEQLAAAHLRALQMQIEPHFLFNTLNAITTLVEFGRQQEALTALSHLNGMLKSTLTQSVPQKVPLSQELEMVDSYLAIEQIRFADRLRIELRIDPNALDGLVPCFLLQPIVENAIRHGIEHCEDDGVVEATARRDGESLHLRIRDTGQHIVSDTNKANQNGHGIGLKNTRERLAHFYPGQHSMLAQPLATGGFEVAITIPYERT